MIFVFVLLMLFLIPYHAVGQMLDETYYGLYNPLLNGSTCTESTLIAAMADTDSAGKTIYVPQTNRAKTACNWTFANDITIPESRKLHVTGAIVVNTGITYLQQGPIEFAKGATLSVAGGSSVAISGHITAPCDTQIFDGAGTVSLVGNRTTKACPQWWGAKGDSTTNDTANLARMLMSQPPVIVGSPADIFYTDALVIPYKVHLLGKPVFKKRTDTTVGLIQLTSGASRSHLDIIIDNNMLKSVGVSILADYVNLKLEAHGWRDNSTNTSNHAIRVSGDWNRIDAYIYDMQNTGNTVLSLPCAIDIINDSRHTDIHLVAHDIHGGIIINNAFDTVIRDIHLENVVDNGVYILSGATNTTILGGHMAFVQEPVVIAGPFTTVQGLNIINPGIAGISIQNAINATVDGVHFITYPNLVDPPGNFIFIRPANVLSRDLTVRNCTVRFIAGATTTPSIMASASGELNDLRMFNNDFEVIWDDSSVSKKLITHTIGNKVVYKDNTFTITDNATAPLTSADEFTIELPPSLDTLSLWKGNDLMAKEAIIRVTDWGQEEIIVRHDGPTLLNTGPRMHSYKEEFSRSRKIVRGTQTPTIGAWGVGDTIITNNPGEVCPTKPTLPVLTDTPGSADALRDDIVTNLIPALQGYFAPCYVIDQRRNTTAGTPGVWKEIRGLTGNYTP